MATHRLTTSAEAEQNGMERDLLYSSLFFLSLSLSFSFFGQLRAATVIKMLMLPACLPAACGPVAPSAHGLIDRRTTLLGQKGGDCLPGGLPEGGVSAQHSAMRVRLN